MSILIRPPGDQFTFRLFYKLAAQIKNKDMLYTWSAVLSSNYLDKVNRYYTRGEWRDRDEVYYRVAMRESIKHDLVLLGVKDHLTSSNFYPPSNTPDIAKYLCDLFEFYKDKKFILFTSLENLESYINFDNVKIVSWGGDITNHQLEYSKLEPVLDKDLSSNYCYLSLNRNNRFNRSLGIALLHGLNYDQHGLISCMFKEQIDNLLYDINSFNPNSEILKIVSAGVDKFKESTLALNDDPEIYVYGNNDNVSNFKNKLIPYYSKTFVELVNETSYTESAFNLTEKTLNSIYGCNFPIIVSSPGSVAFLRNMGLDMFDDIIDHSYDSIQDPVERLYTALSLNQKILTDVDYAKLKWQESRTRFANRVLFAKNDMYAYYENRAVSTFLNHINTK